MRPDYTSIAIMRGGDVIFFRNSAEGDERRVADLVHQTTMYYQDRLGGKGFSRVLVGGIGQAPGARRDGAARARGAPGHAGRTDRPDARRALADRINATPELMATLCAARRHAAADAAGGGERLMLRTNLSTRPFYNVRAVRALLGAFAALVVLVTMCQRRRSWCGSPRSSARSAPTPCRPNRGRAAASGRRAGASQVDAKELEVGVHRRARSQRHHRPAGVLVDDLFAQFEPRCPRTCASPPCSRARNETADSSSACGRGEADRRSRGVHRGAGDDWHVPQRAADGRTGDTDGLIEAVIDGQYVQAPSAAGEKPATATTPRPGSGR